MMTVEVDRALAKAERANDRLNRQAMVERVNSVGRVLAALFAAAAFFFAMVVLNGQLGEVNGQLSASLRMIDELEGEIAILRHQVREQSSQISRLEAQVRELGGTPVTDPDATEDDGAPPLEESASVGGADPPDSTAANPPAQEAPDSPQDRGPSGSSSPSDDGPSPSDTEEDPEPDPLPPPPAPSPPEPLPPLDELAPQATEAVERLTGVEVPDLVSQGVLTLPSPEHGAQDDGRLHRRGTRSDRPRSSGVRRSDRARGGPGAGPPARAEAAGRWHHVPDEPERGRPGRGRVHGPGERLGREHRDGAAPGLAGQRG